MTEEAAQHQPTGATPPPATPTGGPPPPWGPAGVPPPDPSPPGGGTSFTSRYGLVRPHDGRFLAGVCAAIGRATNTDPVLWRVLLAVLGFFGGIGILVYVSAWLIIPGEGDTASPVESMLGRGRSSMSPATVIVLGILVAVSFAFIVTDAFRAVLLGAAILICGALLLNRERPDRAGHPRPTGTPTDPAPPGSYPTPTEAPATGPTTESPFGAVQPVENPGTGTPAEPTVARAHPDDTPTPTVPTPTIPTHTAWRPAPSWAPPPEAPTAPGAPPGGVRPPFAPYGPYAGSTVPPAPQRASKRPRERSALGAVTFSLVFLVLGLLAVLDLAGVLPLTASAYFAAILATVGLGLLVGTWFGRARWLIALGLVTAAALAMATVAESYDHFSGVNKTVTWAPASHAELATRYENTFGDAVLDLRAVDFTGRNSEVVMAVTIGEATVLLPPNVDATVTTDINVGEAIVFGHQSDPRDEHGGFDGPPRDTTNLGADGPGGGTLRLFIHVNAGRLEVTR